jgi:hypothetical protein
MAGASNSRREFLKVSGALALASSGAIPALAATDPLRIALVIGNDAYPHAPLRNAINDARAVADLLERAGFQVTLKINVARDTLRQSATGFGEAACTSEAKLVLFYAVSPLIFPPTSLSPAAVREVQESEAKSLPVLGSE